jgi:hypothetical protein
MDNQPVEIKPGPFSQRTYKTNLDYERTVTNPTEWLRYISVSQIREPSPLEQICKSFNADKKSKATFYLKALRPEPRIQITKDGYVIIQSPKIEVEMTIEYDEDILKLITTIEFDEDILKLIAPCVVTRDSQRFTRTLIHWSKNAKELLQEKPLDARRSVLKGFLNQLDENLKKVVPEHFIFIYHQHGGYSYNPNLEKIKHAKTLVALIPDVDQMDTDTISANLEKVIEAIAQIDQIRHMDPVSEYENLFGDEDEDTHD